jgi:hypothetical protein
VSKTGRVDRLSNQIPDKMGKRGGSGGYIKWPIPPFAPQGLRLNYLLSTCLYTLYINLHHGFLRRRPPVRSGLQQRTPVLRDVRCLVLIITGSSTKKNPSTRLTSVTSSLLVPLPIRFDPVSPSFPHDIHIRTRLLSHMRIM